MSTSESFLWVLLPVLVFGAWWLGKAAGYSQGIDHAAKMVANLRDDEVSEDSTSERSDVPA